jgi:hypothetical protein
MGVYPKENFGLVHKNGCVRKLIKALIIISKIMISIIIVQ